MLTDPARFVKLCKEDLAKYAAGRKQEVGRGRETPEFAALLVQKYGYGMMQTIELIFKLEQCECDEKFFINYEKYVDNAVASINPQWEATDRRRRAAAKVGIEFKDAPPWMIS
jgi:hypothetical protein